MQAGETERGGGGALAEAGSTFKGWSDARG